MHDTAHLRHPDGTTRIVRGANAIASMLMAGWVPVTQAEVNQRSNAGSNQRSNRRSNAGSTDTGR